jgi:hypothetical protein
MRELMRDWHQTLSWKLGHGHAKAGRPHAPPWWVDKVSYAIAYMQGKGVEIPRAETVRGDTEGTPNT